MTTENTEQQAPIEVAAEEIVESANPVSLVERVGEFVDSIVEELGEGPHELDADAVELLNMLQRCSVAVAGVYGIPCGGALLFPAPAMVQAGVVVDPEQLRQVQENSKDGSIPFLVSMKSNVPNLTRNPAESATLYEMLADQFASYARHYAQAAETP